VRRVLVTGAASGLGAALVTAFRARGDEVLATDLSSAVEVRAERASKPIDLVLDITSDDDWAAAVDAVRARWGGLDVGMVRGTRAFVPMLKEQGSGHLVNVASLAGLVHPAGMASYNAVKAAAVAFTETCGHELAAHGIRASVVCPSYFRTNLMDSMQGSDDLVGQVVSGLVERSRITADDIAAAVLAGMDAGDDVIVPDEPARQAYFLKWADRPAYDAVMRDQAAKLWAAGS
jgi:NAD(P)-dependent dehydrogenase (short-subunit alcohol dehydrogenase family)